MKLQHSLILVFLLGIFSIFSCNNDEIDTILPEIQLISPADGDTISIGEHIHFECNFTDDILLKSYKVEIHSNFDEHSHEKSSNAIIDSTFEFSYSKYWNFDDGLKNTLIHHHEIEIPDSINNLPVAQGNYHFGVLCSDDAGNENHLFIDIYIGE